MITQSPHQGRDWTTTRLSVAALLNSLDLMHDFCLIKYETKNLATLMPQQSLQATLAILCERVVNEAAIACADLIPSHKNYFDFIGAWSFTEIQKCLHILLHQATLCCRTKDHMHHIEDLVPTIQKIKLVLQQMDQ
jgi:hypothetical protein